MFSTSNMFIVINNVLVKLDSQETARADDDMDSKHDDRGIEDDCRSSSPDR
jgi:hypothetical protein